MKFRVWLAVVLVISMASAAAAQFGGRRFGFGPRGAPPRLPTADTFGHGFNFCRGVYRSSRGEAGGQGWSTDYPDAELNFSIRLSELTKVRVARDAAGRPDHVTVRLTDEALFQCPYLHMEDVGTITLNDPERIALRTYLLKGGFIWVDDFWGERAWRQFETEMERVLPGRSFVELAFDEPMLNALYRIREIPQIPSIQQWLRMGAGAEDTSERGADSRTPHMRAVYDGKGRMIVLITHNTDIADGWEREGEDQEYFYLFSPEAYAIAVNVLVWAMTH